MVVVIMLHKGRQCCISNIQRSKTRTAVEINITSGQLTAHEKSGSYKSPSQNAHRSDNRPVRVIGEGLSNHTGRSDRETSERVQRDCGYKPDDPPREENQWQRHYNASPLWGLVRNWLCSK